MKRTFFSKAISLFLAMILVISVMPITVFATGTEIATIAEDEQITTFQTVESTLAPGITQSINSGYAADGKLINYYIAVADINREDVGVQASYKDAQCETLGMAKMTEQAAAMNEKYSNSDYENYIPYYAVVAGVNGDGYNTGNAMPSGAHVMNGVSGFGISKAGNSSWFAIFEDGTALCGANNTDWDEAVAAHGPAQEAIGGFQLVRKNGVDCSYSDGSYLNDGRYPRSFVGVTADNKVVFMVADGNGSGGSVGTNWKESVEIMTEAGCTYILCLDGGGSATYISRPEGNNDIQVTSNPSDGSERAVSNGLVMYTCTPPSDVFEKAILTAENTYVTPGSSVNVSAVGVSPAGTSAVIPENAVWTATNGTVENGKFVSDGTIGDAVISLVVDGVVVGSTTVHVVLPDTIAFSRDTITVPFGATIKLDVTAKYGLHNVELKDGDYTFAVADTTMGTVSGHEFTAADSGEGTTLMVSVNGAPTVTDTLEIKFGKGSDVLFDFEEGNIGADLDNWRTSYMYTNKVTSCDLSVVTKETGVVHSGDQALAFHYAMDEALHGTEFWNGGTLIWQGDSIEIKNATSLGFWIYIPEDAVQFSYWIGLSLHDENGNFAGKTASSVEIYNEDYVNNRDYSGWFYFELPINHDAVYIEDNADCVNNYYNGSQFKYKANCFLTMYAVNIDSWKYDETNYAGDFTFYIDDITINYSDAVEDSDKPIFSDVTYAVEGMSDAAALNGQTVTEKLVNFAGFVEDDFTNPNNASGLDESSAVAYIDGVPVSCKYENGRITVEEELTDGVHVIRMGISDNKGNYSEIKRYITVKSGDNDASVRVQPQDSEQIYMLNDSVYWIDVEVDAIETVKTVEMKLDLDSMNNWELENIKTLYGFDCEYRFATAAEKAENILTIKFTRNSDYLAETGTAVIASLPIRVWEYHCSDDHKHPDAVAAWNCSYVCAPALSVDVDTEMGVVTYLDDSSHTFSSEEIHTPCVSYTYGVYLRDHGIDGFYSSHSYHVHSAVAIDDLAATCTEDGYTGRTWCETCASPVEWGTTVAATGHSFAVVDGLLKCECGQTYTGTWTDGNTYVDGVALTGWIDDSYWQDGLKLTGIQFVDGYYYDFGENGVCAGHMKFTGLFYDETVSAWRYAKVGELVGGWVQIGDYWHYFNTNTKVAVTGVKNWGPVFTFDETGMTKGAWYKTSNGMRYYYGPDYYVARNNNQVTFIEIDGKTYNFDKDGYVTTGIHALYDDWAYMTRGEMRVWEFDENGVLIGEITTKGVIDDKRGGLYLLEDDGFVHGGNANGHLTCYNGDYYFVLYSGRLLTNASRWVGKSQANGLLPADTYYFGEDGKLFTGIKEDSDGVLYYYKDGKIATGLYNSELVEIDGSICLVKWSGKVAADETRYISNSVANGLLTSDTYYFGKDGKLFTGIKEDADGVLYYYKDGKVATGIYNSELVEINGSIYLVKWSGKVAANETRFVNASKTNALISADTYYFGEDGKLFAGIKEGADGVLYYYEDGKVANGLYNSELVEVDGSIYLVKFSGKVAANETRFVNASKTNGLISSGTYYFSEDGKMDIPFTGVKIGDDGNLCYYIDGKLGAGLYNSELVEIDGFIYLVKFSGKVAANETRFVNASNTNGLINAGTYYFDAEGKLQK